MSRHEYAIEGLNFQNKLIFDCAIGAGESTFYWAKACHEAGGTSKIIGFEIELNDYVRALIKKNLGDYEKYVTILEKDISKLDEYQSNTVDYINCDDTLVFLAAKLGCLEQTFLGFYRLLKKGGKLIITSEMPITKPVTDYEINQYERWNFAKAVFALKGEIWSIEPNIDEIKKILESIDFKILDEKIYSSYKQDDISDCIGEWKGIMESEINNNIRNDQFKSSLIHEMNRIYSNVNKTGMACPGMFVLKCEK